MSEQCNHNCNSCTESCTERNEEFDFSDDFFGAILQKNYRTQEELVQEIRLLAHNTSVKMNRNLQMIGVLATTAPLLGLLGTVTGMVTTFEIITEYGNGNPVLLAGGISEALITTQSGLLIAFPILLLHNRLEDRN